MARLTREQSREVTREKLRAAAMSEFAVNGFGGTSIDRLCEVAGYSRGAFYANYKNKEELLLDAVRSQHSQEAENWIAILSGNEGLDVLLPRLEDRFCAYIADHQRILFVTEIQLYALRNPEFTQSYEKEFFQLFSRVETLLAILFRKAGKVPHRPIPVLVEMLQALASGLSMDIEHVAKRAFTPGDILVDFLEDILALGHPVTSEIAEELAGHPAG